MSYIRLSVLALAGLLAIQRVSALTIAEKFTTDPAARGWQVFGDTNLFQWSEANQNLAVTWDSTKPNSYFYHPLGTTITRHDDFSLAFDLQLDDIASGVESGKTEPLQIGFGFLNFAIATSTNFMRGAYGSAPNVAEFSYYTSGFYDFGMIFDSPAATVPSFISGINSFHYAPANVSVYNNELPTNRLVHIELVYTASNQTAVITVTTNGVSLHPLPALVLTGGNGFADAADNFLADTFSISSYSSAGDDYDSVLAHGTVGNISVSVPSPAQHLALARTGGNCQVQFSARTNWLFTLERTVNFQTWTNVSPTIPGITGDLTLQDTNPPVAGAFYRIHAARP